MPSTRAGRRRTSMRPFGVALLIVALLAVFLVPRIISVNHQEQVSITVSDKDRVVTGSWESTDSHWIVWSKEGETYANRDAWLAGKTNSSDLQGRLEVGKTYQCTVAGWRIPVISKYRNILSCEEPS